MSSLRKYPASGRRFAISKRLRRPWRIRRAICCIHSATGSPAASAKLALVLILIAAPFSELGTATSIWLYSASISASFCAARGWSSVFRARAAAPRGNLELGAERQNRIGVHLLSPQQFECRECERTGRPRHRCVFVGKRRRKVSTSKPSVFVL